MTMMATLRDPATQALVCVMFADGQTPDELGYEGWEIAGTHEGPPPEDGVFADGAWSVPLDVLKERKRVLVNALKDEKQDGAAPTPLGLVDNDDSSKIKLNGMVTMAMLALQQQQPFSIDWTMADNTVVPLDAQQAMQVGVAAGQYVSAVHERARVLKTLIDAITVDNGDYEAAVAALEAIDTTSGWPTSSAS